MSVLAALQEPTGQDPNAHGQSGEEFDLGSMIGHHILDSEELELPFGAVHLPTWEPLQIGALTLDLSPSKHVVLMLLAAAITLGLALAAARVLVRQGPHRAPRGFASVMETLVVFLRDDVCKGFIGHGYERFVPLILTFFFFIATMNLLGLVPWGGSATGNIAVTATLAVITFLVTEIAGFIKLGPAAYMRTIFFVPPGTSGVVKYAMLAIMTPVELMGKFTKPFALAIRLFANMTAGHMLIFSLLGLIIFFGDVSGGRWLIAGGSFVFVLAILLLELLIAFIQAYIFATLSACFIGLMQHEH